MTTPPLPDEPPAVESGLVIRVPGLPDVVEELRAKYDPAVALGIPTHISVLYPWIPPAHITVDELHRLAEIAHTLPAFDADLATLEWFPGGVLYLAPQPHSAFMQLIDAMIAAYPNYPPYEGRFQNVIPHLTIAQEVTESVVAERLPQISKKLPHSFRVEELEVLCGGPTPNAWRTLSRFTLGG